MKRTNEPATPHRAEKNTRIHASPVLSDIQLVLEKAATTAPELLNSAGKPLTDLVQSLMSALSTAKDHLVKIYSERTASEIERHRSIVIAGLPEPINVPPSELRRRDIDTVSKIMDEINVETTPALVYRLGVPKPTDNGQPTRPRLLKVVLAASFQQRNVLSNAKKLKDSASYSKIFIRPSLTAEERKLDYEIRQAAKKLREAGHRKVHIKGNKLYVGDVIFDHVSCEPLNH
uniref:Uncharacterized protein n=1 Tax=Acrobeloides nanus TaxID=290746 RepID=A0A914CSL1_9BILA